MLNKKIFPALLAAAIAAMPVAAGAARTGVWTGVDFAPDAYYVYLGAVTGLNAQDINTQSGWLLRGDVGFGEYDYDTVFPGPVNTNVEGDVFAGDILIGYRHNFGNGHITAYLGGDLQNHDLSPDDASNSVDGGEGGVKGQIELKASPATNVNVGAIGSYSSAFDTYWSRFDASYDFGAFSLGPEISFLGNEEYHQFRAGAAASDIDIGFANARLYVGHASTSDRGDDGIYGGLGFSKDF
jgi:hypothetical protein